VQAAVDLDTGQPQGVVLVRRSMGVALAEPGKVTLQATRLHETENR